eukprot:scaffold61393_cov59-Cyclotella_meneghiniana.AAC.1
MSIYFSIATFRMHATVCPLMTQHNNQQYSNGVLSRHRIPNGCHHRIAQLTQNGVRHEDLSVKQAARATQLTHTLWRVDRTFGGEFDRVRSGERDAIRPPFLRRNPVPPTRISPNQKALT